ncbi:MAG TPA: hypothetical protein VFP17_12530 [Solirubrobacterales bacterium]|nr:hypothetical protein [Solirubrobacterales bacterium]
MKQKFALLTILGALLALAVPAISSASMYPAGAKFEIPAGPSFSTSLGNCTVKITGQVPSAPANEAASVSIPITPTVSTCSSGFSTTMTGEWMLGVSGVAFTFGAYNNPPEAVVIRSTTLPGCKLSSTGASAGYQGLFLNGTTTPKVMQSSYHGHGVARSFTWANDGGTCAIAGTKEAVVWGSGSGVNSVKNLTTPATPIIASS